MKKGSCVKMEDNIISICCHTRDFDEINQFIEHHLNLGFDRIVIYDNLSINKVEYNDDRVIIINWNKSLHYDDVFHHDTFNDYIENYSNVNGWTAFIDEDEFINTNGRNIKDVLKEFENYDSLGISWKVFGDRIDEDNKSEKLVDKYLYHMPIEFLANTHIKTICKNENLFNFINPHAPILKDNKFNRNVLGEIIPNYFSTTNWTNIWIDHYHVRGLENYIYRKTMGLDEKYYDIQNITGAYHYHNDNATQKVK